VIEGKLEGRIEIMGRRGRRHFGDKVNGWAINVMNLWAVV
jgi:hypothetical protein